MKQRESLCFYTSESIENGLDISLLESEVSEIIKAIYLNDKLFSFCLNSILTSYFLSLFYLFKQLAIPLFHLFSLR